MKKLLMIVPILLVMVVMFTAPVKKAEATFNPCQILPWLCNPSVTPTLTVTPTPTEEPTPTPTEEPKEECPPGYHLSETGLVNLVLTNYEEEQCVPDETPTPEATPTAGLTSNFSSNFSESPKPVCPNGDTAKLVANAHVYRSGESATVNFFITEGDSANIYYREEGVTGWNHSVLQDEVKKYVNGDKFVSFTIHGLKPELGYDFGIQQVNGCGGGLLSVVVDGPVSQLFQFSYWTWLP